MQRLSKFLNVFLLDLLLSGKEEQFQCYLEVKAYISTFYFDSRSLDVIQNTNTNAKGYCSLFGKGQHWCCMEGDIFHVSILLSFVFGMSAM